MQGGINWVPSEVLYEDKYHAGTDVATAKFETPAGVFLTLFVLKLLPTEHSNCHIENAKKKGWVGRVNKQLHCDVIVENDVIWRLMATPV